MNHTIMIKRRRPSDRYYEVLGNPDGKVATSESFDTICRLEASLATLMEAAKSPALVCVEREAERTTVGSSVHRRRVRFVGRMGDDFIHDLSLGIASARVIDVRPASHRRADLSGRLCDLNH